MKENVGKYDYDTYINDKFALHWKIQDDKIYLAVAAEVSGWVAFGISEAGGMPGSDIILFEAAKNTLTDHHAVKYAKPILDNCQDWTLSNSVTDSSAPFILFEAIRALDTGDDQDRVIGDDSYIGSALHKLIFAWGNEPSMVFHGSNRLAANIRFYKSNITSDDASDVNTLDLRVPNYTIPERETTYKTFSFQVSDLQAQGFPANGVAHLIGSRFIPHPETEELVHHILVYGTGRKYYPRSLILAWAPGTMDFETPKDVGIKFGTDPDFFTGFDLEFHYNNPEGLKNKVDKSVLEIKYTTKLRQYDGGILSVGDPLVLLGGKSVGTDFSAWELPCPSSCTERYFSNKEITVYLSALHMHEIGTRMEADHIRDGKIVTKHTSDFFEFRISGAHTPVHKPFQVKSGDSFSVKCYYDTRNNENRVFGLASSDEMCITFYYYYPENPNFHGQCGIFRFDPNCNAKESYNSIPKEEDIGRSFGLGTCSAETSSPTPSQTPSPTPSQTPSPTSTTSTSGTSHFSLSMLAHSSVFILVAYYLLF